MQGCKSPVSPAMSACLARFSDMRPSLPYSAREGATLSNSHNSGNCSMTSMSPSKGPLGRTGASCRKITDISVVTSRSIGPTPLESPPHSK